MSPYSVYLHIPFCTHRCAYCDFNTYAGQEGFIAAYVEAMCSEIRFAGGAWTRPSVHTVFFGGGTPSLLSPAQFEAILQALHAAFTVQPEAEITIEANPGTVSLNGLRELHALGINRISFGVQSANTEELHMLERAHDFFDVIGAVASARRGSFDNLNLDLIYGLPGQQLGTWRSTLQRTLDLQPQHISAYALTLEHGTPFGRWAARGLLPVPDPDLAADMYELAGEVLAEHGFQQYEISNWAQPGRECQHNLQYWRGLPYLAFGAGAHGYAGGIRYSNVLRIKTYIDRLRDSGATELSFPLSPAAVNHHRQTVLDDRSEYMMTNLRLTREGISASEFQARFGAGLSDTYGAEIQTLVQRGLLEWQADRLRLTRRGRLLGNQVFMEFIV